MLQFVLLFFLSLSGDICGISHNRRESGSINRIKFKHSDFVTPNPKLSSIPNIIPSSSQNSISPSRQFYNILNGTGEGEHLPGADARVV